MVTIDKKWLTNVGGIPVEKCQRDGGSLPNVKRLFEQASRFVPVKGVQHTTEGHFGPSLARFVTDTGTPTFMLGYDQLKVVNGKLTNKPATTSTKIRVAQFLPLGEMALTLRNASGGTETNRECHVQIELVGTCVVGAGGFDAWLPDEPVLKVLADLYSQIEDAIHLPLQRGGDGSRSLARWDNREGWFGHGEVPENDHTDPRRLKYAEVFKLAADTAEFWEVRSGDHVLHSEKAGGSPSALDRSLDWMNSHKTRIRDAEKQNGAVKLVRVERRV